MNQSLSVPANLPGRNRARVTILLLGLSAAVALLLIVLGVLHASEVGGAEDAVAVFSEDQMSATTGLFAFAILLQLLLTLATLVCFFVWVYRAVRNLRDANVATEFSPGWSVGWFFIPIANLFMAYRAIRELWHRSGGETDAPGSIFSAPEPTPLIGVWWGAWLINTIVSNIGGRIYDNAETTAQLSAGAWVITLSNVFEIASALLTIYLIHSIMQRQAANPALVTSQSPPPPPDFTTPATEASAPRGF